jgi:CRP/FNR family transcriptional regulator, cyclic AMP receptor protein
MEPLEVLRSHPLLSPLPDVDLLKLRKRAITKFWKKGEVLYRKGGACLGLHGVVSGSVVTVLEAENGKSQTIGAYGPGTYVGAVAVLDGGPFQVTAMAREASCTLFLTRRDFNAAMASLPGSHDRIIRLLCNELRNNLDYLESFLFHDISARLARLILQLQQRLGTAEAKLPSIRFSQRQVAEQLGCSREWVGRELGKLRDAGLIDIGRNHLLIRDRTALERMVGARASFQIEMVTLRPRAKKSLAV